jgi:hypothetical protein
MASGAILGGCHNDSVSLISEAAIGYDNFIGA